MRFALLGALQTHAERPFLVDQGKVISYRRLRDLAFAFLAWLDANDVPPGCSVAFLRGKGKPENRADTTVLQRLITVVALLIGNYTLVEKANALTRVILHDRDPSDREQERPKDRLPTNSLYVPPNWLRGACEGLDLPGLLRAHPPKRLPNAPCLIASSSGTTGVPKRMPISEVQILRRAHRLLQAETMEDGDVLWYNMHGLSNQAILYLVVTILRGGTLTPAINQASHHILSPALFLLQLEALTQPSSADEKPFKEIKVVGSAVSPPMFEKLRRFYRRIRVSYGSTEIGPISSKLVTSLDELKGVGEAYPDVLIRILDGDGNPQPVGSEGEVSIQADSAVPGYLGNRDLTAKAFKNNCFFPGDRGLINEAGELCIVGRSSDMFNIGGVKINAAQQDGILLACKHVEDAMVFTQAGSHGLPLLSALVVLAAGVPTAEAMNVFAAAYQSHGVNFAHIPLHFYFVAAIPRNENGKPMRQQAEAAVTAIQPVMLRDFGHDLIPLGPFSASLPCAQR